MEVGPRLREGAGSGPQCRLRIQPVLKDDKDAVQRKTDTLVNRLLAATVSIDFDCSTCCRERAKVSVLEPAMIGTVQKNDEMLCTRLRPPDRR